MPRLSHEQRDAMVADFHAGMSQRQLSLKYNISKTAVNKHFAGKVSKHKKHVDTLAEVTLELRDASEAELYSIENAVSQRVKDIEFFRLGTIEIAKKALELLQFGNLNMYDLEKAQSIMLKGRETVLGKQPETTVHLNSAQPNEVTYKWEE